MSTNSTTQDVTASAEQRLQTYISRSAGQHKRAISSSFAEARDALESRARHERALVTSASAADAIIGSSAADRIRYLERRYPDAAADLAADLDRLDLVDPAMRRLVLIWIVIYTLALAGGVLALALR